MGLGSERSPVATLTGFTTVAVGPSEAVVFTEPPVHADAAKQQPVEYQVGRYRPPSYRAYPRPSRPAGSASWGRCTPRSPERVRAVRVHRRDRGPRAGADRSTPRPTGTCGGLRVRHSTPSGFLTFAVGRRPTSGKLGYESLPRRSCAAVVPADQPAKGHGESTGRGGVAPLVIGECCFGLGGSRNQFGVIHQSSLQCKVS